MQGSRNTYRIAISGPESTGKSVLARELADHFRCAWVPEYSRDYLEKLDRPYTQEDILQIARGQLQLEDSLYPGPGEYLFCDTEMLVCKIWSNEKFGNCNPWILDSLTAHRYDMYLLCNTDIPWEEDPLRENPHDRERLFQRYLEEIKVLGVPYGIIKGTGSQRLNTAIEILMQHFQESGGSPC